MRSRVESRSSANCISSDHDRSRHGVWIGVWLPHDKAGRCGPTRTAGKRRCTVRPGAGAVHALGDCPIGNFSRRVQAGCGQTRDTVSRGARCETNSVVRRSNTCGRLNPQCAGSQRINRQAHALTIIPRALAPTRTVSMIRPQHLRNGKQRAAGRYKRCASTDN
jgi:hypothetical protein